MVGLSVLSECCLGCEEEGFPGGAGGVSALGGCGDDAVAGDGDEQGVGCADGADRSRGGEAIASDGAVGEGLSHRDLLDALEHFSACIGWDWRKVCGGAQEGFCVEKIDPAEGGWRGVGKLDVPKESLIVPNGFEGEGSECERLGCSAAWGVHNRFGLLALSDDGWLPRMSAVTTITVARWYGSKPNQLVVRGYG